MLHAVIALERGVVLKKKCVWQMYHKKSKQITCQIKGISNS